MNLNSISVTHHMIAGLWKIPEQYCLCCPILEYAIFTVFQTDKRLCQECNPVFSPIIILSDNATGLVFTLYISCMKYPLSYKLRYPLTADAAIQYPLLFKSVSAKSDLLPAHTLVFIHFLIILSNPLPTCIFKMYECPWYLSNLIHAGTCIHHNHRPVQKYVPATASGIAMPHIVTAREYISNIVSPPEPKTPFMIISFTDRPIM